MQNITAAAFGTDSFVRLLCCIACIKDVIQRIIYLPLQAFAARTRRDKTRLLLILSKYIILRPGTANSVANLGWPGGWVTFQDMVSYLKNVFFFISDTFFAVYTRWKCFLKFCLADSSFIHTLT